ncbi:MAG: Uma2 family endonuclease [Deltaproteobacteria bacterium]|nr:Uma2 family endonuclease [Deltaproteobacteria bacterium]MBP6832542.1 Uma2 family endonuclease [Deltaproteobacteria bacterium]
MTNPKTAPGPFQTWHLHSGDPYELSRGHAIYAAPTGHDGAGPNLRGGLVLDTDPLAPAVGVDAGLALSHNTMRAPDLAVGLGPERPGWGTTAPPLAVEYASVGQDEDELRQKIAELHSAGTRWVWVVRLVGPRRVEVHEKGQPVSVVGSGQSLTAPGVLRNAVAIEALYDREAAHEAALRNLLQRQGYESLDDVRSKSREEGREEGARSVLRATVEARGWALSPEQQSRIEACRDVAQFTGWTVRVVTAATVDDVFG